MTASAGTIAGYIVAGVVVLALVALLVMFAVGRRSVRDAAAGGSADIEPRAGRVGRHANLGADLDSVPDSVPDSDEAPGRSLGALLGSDSGAAILDARPGGRGWRRDAIVPIRVAEPGDLDRLAEIEAQSEPGLDGSGLGALPSSDLRHGVATASVLLVAGRPAVAYIRLDEVDGSAHIDQLAVLPAVARRGIGRALLDAAVEWATEQGYRAMTLSTFAESRWNERVYAASGFVPMPVLTPGLLELRDWERAIGLDAIGARVVMRRDLSA